MSSVGIRGYEIHLILVRKGEVDELILPLFYYSEEVEIEHEVPHPLHEQMDMIGY
jgi:hypothetical protein